MTNKLNLVRLLFIGAWLGAAIFFSASVAPSAFGVLRAAGIANAGELAGGIVNRNLSLINTAGFWISVACVALAFPLKNRYGSRAFVVQLMLLGLMALATGVGQWVIAAKMHALRLAMGAPIDSIPLNDPNRLAFATLHGYSVAALSIAIIAGLIVFFIANNSGRTGKELNWK